MASATIDTDAIKQSIDLRTIAGRDVQLRKHTARELCGPCPVCGGTDRFFVAADYWGCRHCQTGGDAIAYMQFAHHVNFQEAVAMLAPNAMPTISQPRQPATTRTPTQSPEWIARASALMATYAAALFAGDNAGAAYLVDRGLCADTWQAFGLGYDDTRNAIAMPWLRRGVLSGIRYRLISPRPDGPKVISEPDSLFSGLLFGGQALPLAPDSPLLARRYLFVVEGEINAMSVHQVGADARCDVLSLGSESAALPDSLRTIAARYCTCIVWMDKEEIARRNAKALDCHAFWSEGSFGKIDANDHLQQGTLGALVAHVLRQATPTDGQQALAYDLQDARLA
jgi:hypothetical protein